MRLKAGLYLELIRTLFQAVDDEGKLRNRVVAFTSAVPKEGVSYVVHTLATELATQTQKRVLAVDALALQSLQVTEPKQVSRHCSETELDNLLTMSAQDLGLGLIGARGSLRADSTTRSGPPAWGSRDWLADPDYRNACIKALRWNFDYVLIDCASLAISSEATTLAPTVDGIAVVVEAGRTRQGQIQRAQQVVETTGGNFLGFVLNQRRYPIPNWLYQRL